MKHPATPAIKILTTGERFDWAMLAGATIRQLSACLVAQSLASHLNSQVGSIHYGRCDPALRTIADETRLQTNQVRTGIALLEKHGFLKILDRGNQRRSAKYSLILPKTKPEKKLTKTATGNFYAEAKKAALLREFN
jgi:hypothetical protein